MGYAGRAAGDADDEALVGDWGGLLLLALKQQGQRLGGGLGGQQLGDETLFDQLGGELGQHLDMVIGTAGRGGNHEEQSGRLAILGAVIDTGAADADGHRRGAHCRALGVGQGNALLEAGVVQLFPGPQVLDELLLIADLALGDQQAGHLAEDLLLARRF
ncbi:hypothetical protein D3C85_417510 [compost metagenome]